MFAAAVDWTQIVTALIVGLPAIIAAWYARGGKTAARGAQTAAHDVQDELKTPSGTSVGKQVEDTQHVALANHYRIRSMTNGLDIPDTEHAQREAQLADSIVHDDEGQPHRREPGDKPLGNARKEL